MLNKAGDWDKAKRLIGNIGTELIEARDTSLKRFGLKAESIAVQHMSKQDLGWKPLKASYLAQKIKQGFSDNILVRTSSYFQAITSWVDKAQVFIGVRRDVKDKDGNVIADIARVHEFGSDSAGIPKRELWKPTLAEAVKWHEKNNMPEKIFLKNIKSKYGV